MTSFPAKFTFTLVHSFFNLKICFHWNLLIGPQILIEVSSLIRSIARDQVRHFWYFWHKYKQYTYFLANPKSMILISLELGVMQRMFSGFRSRCKMFSRCMCWSPEQICVMKCTHSRSEINENSQHRLIQALVIQPTHLTCVFFIEVSSATLTVNEYG